MRLTLKETDPCRLYQLAYSLCHAKPPSARIDQYDRFLRIGKATCDLAYNVLGDIVG